MRHVLGGKAADVAEDGRADVAAGAHRGARGEPNRGDGGDDLDKSDEQHDAAGAPDVVDIALCHAPVNDRGVEVREVQGGQRGDQLEDDHREDRGPIR